MVRVKDALKQAKERPSAFESASVTRKRHNVLGQRADRQATDRGLRLLCVIFYISPLFKVRDQDNDVFLVARR